MRSTSRIVPAATLVAIVVAGPAGGAVIHVPQDHATIQAAIDAASSGDEIVIAPGDWYGTLDFAGRSIELRSSAGPDVTRISGPPGEAIITCAGGESGARLEGFTVHGADTQESGVGGGVFATDCSLAVVDCVFMHNDAGAGGAGVRFVGPGEIQVHDCLFLENTAGVGGGLFVSSSDSFSAVVTGCIFADNIAEAGAGAIFSAGSSGEGQVRVTNCVFRDNVAIRGGGFLAAIGNGPFTMTNVLVHHNEAPDGAGLEVAEDATFINCTIAHNVGDGISLVGSAAVELLNSIVWGNTGSSVAGSSDDTQYAGCSIVEGTWPGDGATASIDPNFLSPATGNFRLGPGTPAAGFSDALALPPDLDDLDGDGSTSEAIPFDLDGNGRVQFGRVDAGAYETSYAGTATPCVAGGGGGGGGGGGDPDPPAAQDDDVDQGEVALLVPGGGPPDPVDTGFIAVLNLAGGANQQVTLEAPDDLYPGSPGYAEIASVFSTSSTLDDGDHRTLVIVPFNETQLDDFDPFRLQLVAVRIPGDDWNVAVQGNSRQSPGHVTPEGDRISAEGPGPFPYNSDLGDHGVYWDPTIGAGFAWANVDYMAHFAVGFRLCDEDTTRDGVVDGLDLIEIILAMDSPSPDPVADVNGDGVVDVMDLVTAILAWGTC